MRGQQRGSVAFIVIVAIIAAVAYWQRGNIASLFSRVSEVGAPPAVALEVSDLRCVSATPGQGTISAMVRNVSGAPLSLDVAAVSNFEDEKQKYHYGTVAPSPLPAGQTGRFELQVAVLPDWKGTCRVRAFTDKVTGKAVGFR